MSFSDLPITFREPRTGSGIVLEDSAELSPSFVMHEIGYLRSLSAWNYTKVCSPFWRLYWNTSAGHGIRYRGKFLPLVPSRPVVIPSFTVFDCAAGTKAAGHLWIHFSVPTFDLSPSMAPMAITPCKASYMLRRQLLRSVSPPIDNSSLRHQVAALLHLILSAAPERPQLPNHPRLNRVLTAMQQRSGGALKNADFARAAGMSAEAFIRWFKRETGSSPKQMLERIRLRHACASLAFSNRTIEDIAEAEGFPNRHYFSRRFQKGIGTSPARFRAMYR